MHTIPTCRRRCMCASDSAVAQCQAWLGCGCNIYHEDRVLSKSALALMRIGSSQSLGRDFHFHCPLLVPSECVRWRIRLGPPNKDARWWRRLPPIAMQQKWSRTERLPKSSAHLRAQADELLRLAVDQQATAALLKELALATERFDEDCAATVLGLRVKASVAARDGGSRPPARARSGCQGCTGCFVGRRRSTGWRASPAPAGRGVAQAPLPHGVLNATRRSLRGRPPPQALG